jgi:CRISPR-associated protein Cmr4
VPQVPGGERALLAPGSRVLGDGEKVYLEDLDLKAQGEEEVAAWERWLAERTEAPVQGRLAVVHDDLMGFLLETATEVVARIRLDDETKTVARGALWYEENLPAESLLYSLMRAERSRRKGTELAPEGVLAMVKGLLERPLQLGGKATVGRGLCRITLVGG